MKSNPPVHGKVRRKDMQPRTTSLHMLSLKAGKNRERIRILEDSLENIKLEIQKIQEKLDNKKTETCPYCGKEFKNLKKHKCKEKPEDD